MQLATQGISKSGVEQQRSKKLARSKKGARAGTIAAIHITWKRLRPDLRHDNEELRQSRLDFMSDVLKREVRTSRGLTQSRLGKVLDAMRQLERAPLLPGAQASCLPGGSANVREGTEAGRMPALQGNDVVHLATAAQTATINRLFAHLGWSLDAIEEFVRKRFKSKSHRMLTLDQANKLTMVLLTIAASRAIKLRTNFARVPRTMLRAEIPALKRRLGIDQAKQEAGDSEEAW